MPYQARGHKAHVDFYPGTVSSTAIRGQTRGACVATQGHKHCWAQLAEAGLGLSEPPPPPGAHGPAVPPVPARVPGSPVSACGWGSSCSVAGTVSVASPGISAWIKGKKSHTGLAAAPRRTRRAAFRRRQRALPNGTAYRVLRHQPAPRAARLLPAPVRTARTRQGADGADPTPPHGSGRQRPTRLSRLPPARPRPQPAARSRPRGAAPALPSSEPPRPHRRPRPLRRRPPRSLPARPRSRPHAVADGGGWQRRHSLYGKRSPRWRQKETKRRKARLPERELLPVGRSSALPPAPPAPPPALVRSGPRSDVPGHENGSRSPERELCHAPQRRFVPREPHPHCPPAQAHGHGAEQRPLMDFGYKKYKKHKNKVRRQPTWGGSASLPHSSSDVNQRPPKARGCRGSELSLQVWKGAEMGF